MGIGFICYVAYIACIGSASDMWYRYFVDLNVASKPKEGIDVTERSQKAILIPIALALCKVGNRLDGIVG